MSRFATAFIEATSATATGQVFRRRSDTGEGELQDSALGEPFKSKAQQRFAFGTEQPWAEEWAHKTPSIKQLPERVHVKKKKAEAEPIDEADKPLTEADRGGDGKFANDQHTAHAREHILAASIALNGDDPKTARDRINKARIHVSHSKHRSADEALSALDAADNHIAGGNNNLGAERLDDAYGKLQGEDNKLLKIRVNKQPRPLTEKGMVRESLRLHPTFIEGTYDAKTRSADVIIITEGMGNKRDKHFYTRDCINEAAANRVFEGAQAYADHPSRQEDIDRPERSVRDLIGYYYGTHPTQYKGKSALAGKLRIIEGQDFAVNLIREAISYNKLFPDQVFVGISINADGDTAPGTWNGEDVNMVHHITESFSADMVTKPARGGTFLRLVESHKSTKEQRVKFAEAVARLNKLTEGGEIDTDEFKALVKVIESAKVVEEGANVNAAPDKTVEAAKTEAAKTEAVATEAGKTEAGKTEAKTGKTDGTEPDEDDPAMQESARRARESTVGSVTAKELKERYPSIWAAALREARASVGTSENQHLAAVLSRNAELEGTIALHESISAAKRLLSESKLPELAHERVMRSIVGLTESEMRGHIKDEERYLQAFGVGQGKEVLGAAATVVVRESGAAGNTKAVMAGIYGD